MSWYSNLKQIFRGDVTRGKRVVRAAQTYPAATTYDLFTVAGGDILVTSLVGEVTADCGAGACTGSFMSRPTVGAHVHMDDNSGSLNGVLTGTVVAPTGLAANAPAIGQAVPVMATPMVCKVGFISMIVSAATLGTGQIKFTLHYIPLEPGAVVTVT